MLLGFLNATLDFVNLKIQNPSTLYSFSSLYLFLHIVLHFRKFLDDASDNDEQNNNASPSYFEEQEQLKADLKKAIIATESDANNDDLLVKRNKSSVEEVK